MHTEFRKIPFSPPDMAEITQRGLVCNVHCKPLPMMTTYKAMGFDIKDFPNVFLAFDNEMTLSLNTRMSDEDLEYVVDNFIDVVRRFR